MTCYDWVIGSYTDIKAHAIVTRLPIEQNIIIKGKSCSIRVKLNIFLKIWLLNVQNVRFIVLILLFVRLMVFNATFNNISVISWQSVLLVEETGVTDKLYHIMLYTLPCSRLEHTTSVMIGTDCIGRCKSNYHTIAATTAPCFNIKTWVNMTLYFQIYCER
jgi:hypothetical protein